MSPLRAQNNQELEAKTTVEWIEVLKIEKETPTTKKTTIFSVNKETNLVETLKVFMENWHKEAEKI